MELLESTQEPTHKVGNTHTQTRYEVVFPLGVLVVVGDTNFTFIFMLASCLYMTWLNIVLGEVVQALV